MQGGAARYASSRAIRRRERYEEKMSTRQQCSSATVGVDPAGHTMNTATNPLLASRRSSHTWRRSSHASSSSTSHPDDDTVVSGDHSRQNQAGFEVCADHISLIGFCSSSWYIYCLRFSFLFPAMQLGKKLDRVITKFMLMGVL
jgi:hypothetical protein